MPRVLCRVKPPLEYLTPGELYDVQIGEIDVHYQRVGQDGRSYGQPATFGRRWNYARYIRDGELVLVQSNAKPGPVT